jgi:antitoxin component of RelBE/YafQ-DinJ toxin-antitoxin module
MKSILLTLDDDVKQALKAEADKLGMKLVTYIRMILIKSLKTKQGGY